MCGRYTLAIHPDALQAAFSLESVNVETFRYNIAPTQLAPVILSSMPRRLTLARWGVLPPWARSGKRAAPLFNARSETVHQKRPFQKLLPSHRCLVPCTGFFEWKHHGKKSTPVYIRKSDRPVLAMAGLWTEGMSTDEAAGPRFTILTEAADETISTIHDRMPVFLDQKQQRDWLDDASCDDRWIAEVTKAHQKSAWEMIEVAPLVNSPHIDDDRCIAPASAPQLQLF